MAKGDHLIDMEIVPLLMNRQLVSDPLEVGSLPSPSRLERHTVPEECAKLEHFTIPPSSGTTTRPCPTMSPSPSLIGSQLR